MTMEGYHSLLFRIRTNCNRGGVGLFIKETHIVRDDLSVFIPHVIETLFVEFKISETKKAVLGVIIKLANEELDNLFKWLCVDKLCLNTNKTKFMLIYPK